MSKTIYPSKLGTADIKGINVISGYQNNGSRWVVTTKKEGIVKLYYSPR